MFAKKLLKTFSLLLVILLLSGMIVACKTTKTEHTDQSPKSTDDEKIVEKEETPEEEQVQPVKEQKLVYNAVSDTLGYDPRNSVGLDQRNVINLCFEGLVKVNENSQIVEGMAEKWEVKDEGMTYLFYLRDDVKWSDGQPVVAADFEYAWKSQIAPEFGSGSADRLYMVLNAEKIHNGEMDSDELGVKALDEKTLEVKLETANPFALHNFASPTYYPVRKDVADNDPEGWTLEGETYIGNGPFKMVTWSPKESIEFVKNENYYNKDLVKLDEITFIFVEEATTALAAFKRGDIDVLEQLPSTEVQNLINDGYAIATPMVATYYYSINMGEDFADEDVKKALWNKDVRHALNLAIDRVAIVETILQGGEIPAYGFAPEGIIGPDGNDFRVSKKYFDPKGDVDKAKELLANAGYPDGKDFPVFEIFYNTSETHKAVAEAVQDMWKKNLGIDVNLVNKETKVFAQERAAGKHQIARSGNTCAETHPSILGLFTDTNLTSTNDPKYINPAYIDLIKEAEKETDVSRIFELYHQAEDILMEDMPVIPIYYYSRILATQKDVQGIYKTGSGAIYFDRAYIE
jgi:oligopeptide transport system substrate-binding protein